MFHFCEAPTLLHLQKVGRSLHKLITIEDIARGLAMQWEVEEFDDHPKGVTIMLRRDWDPEFSTEASVLQAAIKNVAEGSHIRYDLQHGRTFASVQGLVSEDFDPQGTAAQPLSEEGSIDDEDSGWRTYYSFQPNLEQKVAKSRAMKILNKMHLMPPVGEDVGLP